MSNYPHFSLKRAVSKKCESAIIVSGSARSGTTIIGKLVNSFDGVEYCFEPPILFSLFPLIYNLEERDWKLLYETYLYEEFLINSLAGRNINLNHHDDSSIFKVKEDVDITSRLSKSHTKADIEKNIDRHSISFKIPDVVSFLPQLTHYYPETRLVLATRKAPEVFASIFRKGWFDDSSMQNSNLIWPFYTVNNVKVPFWVKADDAHGWLEMDELHRIAYYYISMNKSMSDLENCFQVKYDSLIKGPESTARSLAEFLNVEFTKKTYSILKTVSLKSSESNMEIINGLDKSVLDEVLYYSELS